MADQLNVPVEPEVSIESNLHPLFLQNLDHPGLILISKKLTGTDNFGPWKRSISIALSAKNKLGMVNGTCLRPDDSSPLAAHWDRVNDMVISWIMNTVTDEISNGMDFVTSAKDLWDELHDQFSSINGHRVYQVLKDLHTLEQGDKSVEIYYHKLKNLWDEYTGLESVIACKCGCKCGSAKLQEEREQRKKLLQFLMGLNNSYTAARGQILMMTPLPTISQAFSLIKQDEKQKQGSPVQMSFLGRVGGTDQQPRNFTPSSLGQRPTNYQGNNRPAYQGNRPPLRCTYCNKDGHTREFCFKLHGGPDKRNNKGKQRNSPGFRPLPQAASVHHVTTPHQGTTAQNSTTPVVSTPSQDNSVASPSLEEMQSQISHMNQMMILMMNKQKPGKQDSPPSPEEHLTSMSGLTHCLHSYLTKTICDSWIIDTGASNHMCCNKSLLNNIVTLSKPFKKAC